jgi:hypothetical protein
LTAPDDAIFYIERIMSQMTQEEEGEMEDVLGVQNPQNTFSTFTQIDLRVNKRRFSARPLPLSFDYQTVMGTFSSFEFTDLQKIEILSGVMALGRDQESIDLARRSVSTLLSIPFLDKDILRHIADLGGVMYGSIGRGIVNRLIVDPSLIPKFQTIPSWIDTLESGPALRRVGLLNNEIEVFTMNTGIEKGEIFCIYKNPDEPSDYSLVFGTLNELSLSLDYPKFMGNSEICRISDRLIINREFIKKIEIKN